MTATAAPVSLQDLVEDAVARLSSQQLHALAARKAAAELRAAQEVAPPLQVPDLATELAFDPDATVSRLVGTYTEVGVDTDIAAAWLLPQLLRAGASEADALDVLSRVTGWRPRTEEERTEAVEREMLTDGFTPEQVRVALRSVPVREVG